MTATITDLAAARKPAPVTRYALLTVGTMEIEGTATLVNGSGYLFRADGQRRATLVAWNDPNLLLLGLIEVDADPRPLWERCADPATYNGTYGRTLTGGR